MKPITAVFGSVVVLALGCGGTPPVTPPKSPTGPVAKADEGKIDLEKVPEPDGLIAFGRVSHPDTILKSVSSWSRFPLPSGKDLVSSMSDDSVGDVVDLSQPIDGAAMIKAKGRDPEPLLAFSIAVTSYDTAKTKLGSSHRLSAGPNGQFTIEGLSFSGEKRRKGDDEDEERPTCVLAPAAEPKGGGRIVCGEPQAVVALSPYLTRTLVRQTFKSDVHVEMRVGPVREPLNQLKAMLPMLARSLMGGQSPSLRELGESVVNEAVDVVGDTERVVLDAQLPEAGADAEVRMEFQHANSLIAKLATSNADKASTPPAAFMHLPAETDLAFYSRGSDPKLFDRPKELLGRVALELTADTTMPEAERKMVKELVVDKLLPLFTGPLVYGKGYDAAAIDKALTARKAVKPNDAAANDEAERVLGEQVVGWHLVQVGEPAAKVGGMLKEWSALWARPAFQKWVKTESSAKMMAQVRNAPVPAGLPKETVHLEVVIPRHDLVDYGGSVMESKPVAAPPGAKPAPAPKAAPPKKIPRKPLVFHVFAVPDQGATWIAFGFDAKLLAAKATIALSSGPDKDTLAKTGTVETLKDVKSSSGWLLTARGLLVFTAMKHRDRTPYAMLASLPNKGATPITFTSLASGPQPNAAAGTLTTHFKLPKAAIEDLVKVGMAR